MTTQMKCCQLEKLIRDSEFRVFIGGWSHRHMSMHVPRPIRESSGRKTHTQHEQSRHSKPLIPFGEGPMTVETCLPAKGQPCKQAFKDNFKLA